MNKAAKPVVSRRLVFASAGSAGVLAAAAVALPGVRPVTPAASADSTATADADGRYQATQHVLRYYQTAKV
jgi:hypothetical protein